MEDKYYKDLLYGEAKTTNEKIKIIE